MIDGLFATHYGKAFLPTPAPHLPPTTYPQSLPPASFPTLAPKVLHRRLWKMAARLRRRICHMNSTSSSSDCDETPSDKITPTKKRPAECNQLILDFSKPWKMSDLVLLVEERKLHVHKAILAISSPVFEAMLSSNFKEKNAKEIPLPGKKVEQMEDLLRAIYPYNDYEHAISRQNCCSLLELSSEYQMDELKKRCEKFVLDTYKPMITNTARYHHSSAAKTLREEALQFVVVSQRHQLSEEVVQRCITTFVSQLSRWDSMQTNMFYSQLEAQNRLRIMEERVKFLETRLDTCNCGARLTPSSPSPLVSPTVSPLFSKLRRVR